MADLVETIILTASFVDNTGSMPWGTYNADANFQAFQNGLVKYTYYKLGGDTLQVELTNKDIWAAGEEAALEYSAIINTYHAKSVLADIIGSQTGSLSGNEQKLPRFGLGMQKRMGDAYGSEALVGGTRTLHSASISLIEGEQNYDLQAMLSASGIISGNQRIEIKEIFHFSPTAAYRFFDTTSAMNYLHNQFSFESFTPETVFYMLPIWEDVLRASQLKQSFNVRRSHYSYDVVNNHLRIYPIPTTDTLRMHFTYFLVNDDPFANASDPQVNGVTNLNNVPFGNISFSNINSIGLHWIRRLGFAFAKETLGQVRDKVKSIPIPNGDLNLNGADLVAQAREEEINLREELKAQLEETTYANLQAKQMEAEENLKKQMTGVPLGIYIG